MNKFLRLIALSLPALPFFIMTMERPPQHYPLTSILHDIRYYPYDKIPSFINQVSVLLDNGADPNHKGTEGITPLQIAISKSCPRTVIIMLLAAGGNIYQANNLGTNAFTLYKKGHISDDISWFQSLENPQKLLKEAIKDNILWAIRKLITEDNVNYYDEKQMTPLGYAIKHINPEVAEVLFSMGASPVQVYGKKSIMPLEAARATHYRAQFLDISQLTLQDAIIALLKNCRAKKPL